MRDEAVGSKTAEIEIEIPMHGNELADFEAAVSFAQPVCRMEAGRVIVARNVKTAQGRG
jgi:hypothetical protein